MSRTAAGCCISSSLICTVAAWEVALQAKQLQQAALQQQ